MPLERVGSLQTLVIAVMVAVGLSSCQKEAKAPPETPAAARGDLGTQAANLAADTAVLREANAAVGDLVRNAADCEFVKSALVEANRKLDEAGAKVRTSTGRTTVDVLRKQVKTIAEACG